MRFHPASAPSLFAFLLICGAVVALFLRAIWVSARSESRNPVRRTLPVAGGVILWLTLAAGLVASGWVQAAAGRLLVFGGVIMLGSLLLGFSRFKASVCPWRGFFIPGSSKESSPLR